MELDEANKEAAEINEDVEMKPEIQLNEIIDRPEVNEIDHEACLSKLFSLSDYPMFSFCNDGQTGENKVYIDCYGIYVSNQQENEDMYLDELQNKLNRGDVYIDKDNDEELADGENYLYSTSKNDGLFGYDLDPNSKESMYQNIIDNYKNIDIFYNYIDENILVECPIAYIPFEGRIDKKSFQIILSETRPKNLIIVNSSPKKVDRIKDFVEDNKLNINVLYLKDNPLSFEIIKESDIIYIEPTLTNSNGLKLSSTYDSKKNPKDKNKLSISNNKFGVSRIFGKLTFQDEQPNNEEHKSKKSYILQHVHNDIEEINKQEKFLFESKSLLFKDICYRLSDLQKYLGDNGIPVRMINKKLNYENKVEIYQDQKGELQIVGQLCEEYIQIRKLIYEHFGRV